MNRLYIVHPPAPQPPAAGRAEPEPFDGLAEENLRILDEVFSEAGIFADEALGPATPDELEQIAAIRSAIDDLRRTLY